MQMQTILALYTTPMGSFLADRSAILTQNHRETTLGILSHLIDELLARDLALLPNFSGLITSKI